MRYNYKAVHDQVSLTLCYNAQPSSWAPLPSPLSCSHPRLPPQSVSIAYIYLLFLFLVNVQLIRVIAWEFPAAQFLDSQAGLLESHGWSRQKSKGEPRRGSQLPIPAFNKNKSKGDSFPINPRDPLLGQVVGHAPTFRRLLSCQLWTRCKLPQAGAQFMDSQEGLLECQGRGHGRSVGRPRSGSPWLLFKQLCYYHFSP